MATSLVRRRLGNRGQTLIEFSLCALLLVMLLIGVVEVSRMVVLYTTIANAVKTGARYAIVNGSDVNASPTTDDPNVVAVVNNFAGVAGLNTANLTVHVNYYSVGGVSPACNNVGCWVQVTASYPYDPLTSYFPISVTLGSTSEGAITF